MPVRKRLFQFALVLAFGGVSQIATPSRLWAQEGDDDTEVDGSVCTICTNTCGNETSRCYSKCGYFALFALCTPRTCHSASGDRNNAISCT